MPHEPPSTWVGRRPPLQVEKRMEYACWNGYSNWDFVTYAVPLDQCAGRCSERGQCVRNPERVHCICRKGFKGAACELDDDEGACWFAPNCNGHGGATGNGVRGGPGRGRTWQGIAARISFAPLTTLRGPQPPPPPPAPILHQAARPHLHLTCLPHDLPRFRIPFSALQASARAASATATRAGGAPAAPAQRRTRSRRTPAPCPPAPSCASTCTTCPPTSRMRGSLTMGRRRGTRCTPRTSTSSSTS